MIECSGGVPSVTTRQDEEDVPEGVAEISAEVLDAFDMFESDGSFAIADLPFALLTPAYLLTCRGGGGVGE